ncbi:hypothetical protein [Frigidibacter sp. SD6-1]|uniref:hypothetical protein n=1 Tax=Frigidibacter sp. SD6-1 TaxID=3032581 RepID=UPI0024E01C58|nr:hypothetical protein [Frigidibacter sp. SD6-1]
MTYQWIFDVLGDLKTFSTLNGLPELAAQVDRTIEVAAAEVTRAKGGASVAFPASSCGALPVTRRSGNGG